MAIIIGNYWPTVTYYPPTVICCLRMLVRTSDHEPGRFLRGDVSKHLFSQNGVDFMNSIFRCLLAAHTFLLTGDEGIDKI
ncbi:MAG TPA: hypothetical protein VGN20_08585 [Mucilaginibacter sp.]